MQVMLRIPLLCDVFAICPRRRLTPVAMQSQSQRSISSDLYPDSAKQLPVIPSLSKGSRQLSLHLKPFITSNTSVLVTRPNEQTLISKIQRRRIRHAFGTIPTESRLVETGRGEFSRTIAEPEGAQRLIRRNVLVPRNLVRVGNGPVVCVMRWRKMEKG